ncbi:two-component response regulator [Jannaschia pagri]|uniref:Two-component response regulator n=1 Tax=Jannaschia pagri TaxID=2829797 RepID=A0ABQ4NN84_9RHOB|nr:MULTISPECIES: response regulator [unclassified Jannaschia]GIT92038.1 two-component response regulator [Jannaschia sp. AI_61]GIT95872.1 two-component response regulator [Jannaschia sp. AI_62]
MDTNGTNRDLGVELTNELPFLRRYARALTGAQDSGDRYALATLEAIVADPSMIPSHQRVKIGLFRTFHGIWASAGAPIDTQDEIADLLEARAQWRLQHLTANTREVLLLHTVEGFSIDEIAAITNLSNDEVTELHARALADMGEMVTGDVLIIEDEGIIAMDLKSIVSTMGHTVVDIARTCDEAIAKGKAKAPDLILADIQLADRSSGIDAVNALLQALGDRPVIFITAFPERLLTGDRPEPAFLITKPYVEEQVRAAVSQAMFFATTQHLSEPA